jgi:hypothetical protein
MLHYGPPDRIHLFGGGPAMYQLARWLCEVATPCTIWTSPRHFREDVENCKAPPDRVRIIVSEDINRDFPPAGCENALGITFGPAWKFNDAIRGLFGHRLVDFMSIPFPQYQGGAHITWARLRRECLWGCAVQLVTENTEQGVRHDGGIIRSAEFNFIEHKLGDEYQQFLRTFIRDCMQGLDIIPTTEVTGESFFPRLNTALNGAINWAWELHDVVSFIHAFDAPYPGAWTFLNGERVTLHAPEPAKFYIGHPFMSGMVLKTDGDRFLIAAGNAALWVSTPAPLVVGDRLFTPQSALDAARFFPTYNANGPVCPPSSAIATSTSPTSLPSTSTG